MKKQLNIHVGQIKTNNFKIHIIFKHEGSGHVFKTNHLAIVQSKMCDNQ